jgi:uncharacterized protein
MTRRDWLMLFIAFEGAPRGLDPVRLQKGLFLFAQEAQTVPSAERYVFRPYSYGPMSRDIYADLDDLVSDGLVERMPVEGQTWARYKPTLRGVEKGHRLINSAIARHADDTRRFYEMKQSVADMTFATLLEDVYDRYPAYATNSIFRRH